MRVVIADDSVLCREGLARVLADGGFEVAAQAGDGDALREAVRNANPDVVIVDVRMPPTQTDEGTRVAKEIRAEHAGVAVLMLSQTVEVKHAFDLFSEQPEGFGYLLKDRVLDVDDFLDAARRVSEGGSALDPQVVARLLSTEGAEDPLEELSPREREVLSLMAEGRTNAGIAKRLWLTEKTVETHVSSILGKLGLPLDGDTHRRVLAVVTYLRGASPA